MIKEPRVDPRPTAATPSFVLVLNCLEELRQRVRAK